MGEEKATSLIVPIALRVQKNHPDSESIGMILAATSILLLGGFTDPRDRHVLHAAQRLRERLDLDGFASPDDYRRRARSPLTASSAPPAEQEQRPLTDEDKAEVERLMPRWEEARTFAARTVPESTFRLWIDPVMLVGRRDKKLILAAPMGICAWTARRYSTFLLECIQAAGMPAEDLMFVNWLPVDVALPQPIHDDADQPGQGPGENTTGGPNDDDH